MLYVGEKFYVVRESIINIAAKKIIFVTLDLVLYRSVLKLWLAFMKLILLPHDRLSFII